MKDVEIQIITKLAEAHNLFVTLPVQHPDDTNEWVTKLHDLQRIIMAREAVRNNPEIFVNISDQ